MKKLMNQYILGDAFDYFPMIPSESVDLIFTSVPDLSEVKGEKNSLKYYQIFMAQFVSEACRIVNPKGFIVLSQTDRRMNGMIIPKHNEFINRFTNNGFILKDYKILVKDSVDKKSLFKLNYSHVLIFTKKGKIPTAKRKDKYLEDVWVYPYPKGVAFDQDYSNLIVKTFSNKDDFVVDPFAGRGTVIKSCIDMGRKYLGIEYDKKIYNKQYIMGDK